MLAVLQATDEVILTTLARIVEYAMQGYQSGLAAAPLPAVGHPEQQEAPLVRKAHASLDYALDLYLGVLVNHSAETRRKYRQILEQFCAMYEHLAPGEVERDDCRRFLNRWADSSPSTYALHVSILRGFFRFLLDEGIATGRPMDGIDRPRRHHPEDLDVVSVTGRDVRLMFEAIETWQELICLGVFCYAGVRRNAAANARRRDVDFDAGTIKFREKGGKVIVKPVADELAAILRAADEAQVWESPNAWLIPNFENRRGRKASLVERSNRIVYDTVKRIANRCGVDSHCHALRAAFAVQFDEANPGHTIALKELLGHSRIETTMVYLRRKDKAAAMETVRTLSWNSSVFPEFQGVPPAGFEPALQEELGRYSDRAATGPVQVPQSLQLKLDQLSQSAKHKRVRR